MPARFGLITASGDIGPHRSFIVLHQTTDVTKTHRKYQLFYSKYCSSSTLIKNCQFVIISNYVNLCLLSGWRYGSVVRASVFGWWTFPDLFLICGWHMTTSWVRCLLWVNQPGHLSLPSLWGR